MTPTPPDADASPSQPAPRPGRGRAARLWSDNSDLAQAALAHPFVRGIGDGTLPRTRFASFIAQDAYFLESFARAYGLALARSPDTGTVLVFADLIAGVRDELALHGSYAAHWGASLADARPSPATLAYSEFLLATSATAGLDALCAAMTPCMRLYAWLGSSLATSAGTATSVANPYAEWIGTYADPAFEALAARLESVLDQLSAGARPADDAAVSRAYRRAMHLELAFFDAAHSG